MRKWPQNNGLTAHNSLYHLQKDPDGTSIQRVPLKRTDGGLRCKERNPPERKHEHFPRKKKQVWEQENYHVKENQPYLSIQELSSDPYEEEFTLNCCSIHTYLLL